MLLTAGVIGYLSMTIAQDRPPIGIVAQERSPTAPFDFKSRFINEQSTIRRWAAALVGASGMTAVVEPLCGLPRAIALLLLYVERREMP